MPTARMAGDLGDLSVRPIWSTNPSEESLDAAIQAEQTAQTKEELTESYYNTYQTLTEEATSITNEIAEIDTSIASTTDQEQITELQAQRDEAHTRLISKNTETEDAQSIYEAALQVSTEARETASSYSSLLNSCQFANDGVCDDIICPANTDTDDCRGEPEIPSGLEYFAIIGSAQDAYDDPSGDKMYELFLKMREINKEKLSESCNSTCSQSDIVNINNKLVPVIKDKDKSRILVSMGKDFEPDSSYFDIDSGGFHKNIKDGLINLSESCEQCIINNIDTLDQRTCGNTYGMQLTAAWIDDDNTTDFKYNCPNNYKDKQNFDEIKCSSDKDCKKNKCCDKKISKTTSSLVFGGGTSLMFSFCCCICIVLLMFVVLRFWLINKSLEGMGMKSTKQKLSAVAFHKMI